MYRDDPECFTAHEHHRPSQTSTPDYFTPSDVSVPRLWLITAAPPTNPGGLEDIREAQGHVKAEVTRELGLEQ